MLESDVCQRAKRPPSPQGRSTVDGKTSCHPKSQLFRTVENIHGVAHATRKKIRRKSGETELSGLRIFLGPTADHAAWRRLALARIPLPDSKLGTTMAHLCVGSAGERAIRMGSEHISSAELRRRQRGIREPIERARGAGGTLHRGCNRADGRRAMPRQGEGPDHRGYSSDFG